MLVEGPAPWPRYLQGLSDHYLRVTFPGPPTRRNRRVMVRFRNTKEDLLVGEPLEEP
jgi:hypothetical protein